MNDPDQGQNRARTGDIGWKQFSIGLLELLRWPAIFVIIVVILHAPVERLLDAITLAMRT